MKSATKNRCEAALPRSDQAAKTKAGLLQAAEDCFARWGYDGVGVNTIAEQANVNKQLVYYYFGSKELLFKAVLESVYLRFRSDDDSLLEKIDDPDPLISIRKLAKLLYQRTPELVRFQRILQDVNLRGPDLLKDLVGVREAYRGLIEVVAVTLRRGVGLGVIRADVDPLEFYLNMAGVCAGRLANAMSFSHVLGADLISDEGVARSQAKGMDLLIDGIRQP